MGDTLPLSRFPFLETCDVDEAREALGTVYVDGRLAPIASSKSFLQRFNVVPLGRVTLTAMEWGCGMIFQAPSLDGCFDFSLITHGAANVRVGRETVKADPNIGVVMSSLKPLDIRWSDRLVSLNAKVERGPLESYLAAITGIEIAEPLEFNATISATGATATIRRLVHLMADEVNQYDSLLANPLVSERYSETLLTAILFAQPHNYSELLSRSRQSAPPRYVRRAEEYLEAHCDEPITAEALSTVVGVSLRTLYTGFRKHRDYTPMAFLRSVRLRRVRDALLSADQSGAVSQLAFKWGFRGCRCSSCRNYY